MLYVSAIKMSSSNKAKVILEGDLVLNHCLIIKNVQLIRGHHQLFLKFPTVNQSRLIHPLSHQFYLYLLNRVIEYYAHYLSDS